jgi:hypothetical protein
MARFAVGRDLVGFAHAFHFIGFLRVDDLLNLFERYNPREKPEDYRVKSPEVTLRTGNPGH